jgi:membrane-associated phospholipid phosphatase
MGMVTKLAGRQGSRASKRAAARFARMDEGRQPAARRAVTVPPAPRPTFWRQLARRNAWRELANVAAITFAYFMTRGIVRGREGDAFANAYTLIEMERALGIYHEQAIQQFALANDWLITFVNNYYLYGHLPVLVGVAVWLFWWRPALYPWFRNAFIISAAIGLTIYVAVPMAPPRFLPGYVDTMQVYGFDVDGSAAGPMYNPYAAMPSLHTGWSVLSGFGIFIASRRWWGKALGIIVPTLMVVSVVMTGNHFFLDAVVGTAVVALALAIGWAVVRGPWAARREAEVAEQRVPVRS